MSRRHELKTDAGPFAASRLGTKTWEIRKDDRGYALGDVLVLKETKHTGAEMRAGLPLEYTGAEITRRVVYIMRGPIYGLDAEWVVMSVVPES